MNHGLILEPIKPEDYVFGGSVRLGGDKLVPGGQWDLYLPEDERQNLAVEPMACTSFGTLNAVETLAKKEYGEDRNYSDRFLAKISVTTPQGNNPQTVAETLRKNGCVLEKDWAYTPDLNTWEKFYSVIPMSVQTLALSFDAEFDFGHEYVTTDQQSMMNALEYSPLCVDVYAWESNSDGLYIRNGNPSGHWVMIYGYVQNRYWKCFDSYTNTHKELVWDFGFTIAKRYTLHKQVVVQSWFDKFLSQLRAILFPMASTDNSVLEVPISPVSPETPPQSDLPSQQYPDARVKPKMDRIKACAVAQQQFEGWWPGSMSYKNNNPGNCRGVDGQFLVFKSYEAGFKYLEDYITRVAKGVHKAYPKGGKTTLLEYTHIYTSDKEPAPSNYAVAIAKATGLSTGDPMSALLN